MAPDTSGKEPGTSTRSLLAGSLRESLSPALLLVEEDGQVAWTPQARQMLKLGEPASTVAAGAGLPAPLLALAQDVIRSESGAAARALDYSAGSGANVKLRVAAMRTPGLKPPRVLLVLHDLTNLEAIDQLLLQADRLAKIGAISASMAHEIRNALVACRTFLDLLLERNQDAELAGLVRREVKRIDDLISRMLRHSSTAAGKRCPLHVHEVLQNALRLLAPRFSEKSVVVEHSFKATPDLLDGDENQLQQAFMNLLLNGCEAAPHQGRLRVETHCATAGAGPGSRICITIADNGPGIAPENLERIFEPFFTTKPEGTGLGLAVTHRIVREHLGSITVESQPGQGTWFRLFLPV